MKKTQTQSEEKTWRVYMFFPSSLYFKLKRKAPTEGYTKRELDNDMNNDQSSNLISLCRVCHAPTWSRNPPDPFLFFGKT